MFYNIEIKKFTYLYCVTGIIFFLITLIGCNIIINRIDDEYKNLAYDLVKQSYESLDEESKSKAIEEVNKKGVQDYNPSAYASEKLKSLGDLKMFICLVFILISILNYIIFIIFISGVYKKIRKLSKNTEKIIKRDYEVEVEKYQSGDFGLLTSNFMEMVRVIKESQERELSEKLFLKDIISDISHQLKTPLASLKVFNEILLDNLTKTEGDKTKVLEESKKQLNRIEWFSEAVINILKNAIEYTEFGGKIEVSVEKTVVLTKIKIKDNGIGIDEKEIPKVFERFYRVNNSVNPSSVGIGLSLAKKIIEGQNGSITVESKKNQFTCFIITFFNIKI